MLEYIFKELPKPMCFSPISGQENNLDITKLSCFHIHVLLAAYHLHFCMTDKSVNQPVFIIENLKSTISLTKIVIGKILIHEASICPSL